MVVAMLTYILLVFSIKQIFVLDDGDGCDQVYACDVCASCDALHRQLLNYLSV